MKFNSAITGIALALSGVVNRFARLRSVLAGLAFCGAALVASTGASQASFVIGLESDAPSISELHTFGEGNKKVHAFDLNIGANHATELANVVTGTAINVLVDVANGFANIVPQYRRSRPTDVHAGIHEPQILWRLFLASPAGGAQARLRSQSRIFLTTSLPLPAVPSRRTTIPPASADGPSTVTSLSVTTTATGGFKELKQIRGLGNCSNCSARENARTAEQLKASQEQMARAIANTSEQNLRRRTSATPPPPIATPARRPVSALPPREARAQARVPVTLRPDNSSPHRRRLCCGGILAGRGGKALPPAEVETAQMRDLVLDRCFGRGATSATFLLHRVRPPVWPGPQLQAKL